MFAVIEVKVVQTYPASRERPTIRSLPSMLYLVDMCTDAFVPCSPKSDHDARRVSPRHQLIDLPRPTRLPILPRDRPDPVTPTHPRPVPLSSLFVPTSRRTVHPYHPLKLET